MADALATVDLRRIHLAWATSAVGSWVFFIALAVYAYDAGGAAGVGVAALVRMVPAGLAAPFAGVLVDRHARRDVLLASLLLRVVTLLAIAVAVATAASVGIVFALAALFTVVASAHKPAQAALLPSLAGTPRQLAACNAVWSGLDNAAFLVGSLLGGALIATASTQAAVAATAALFALAVLPVARVSRDAVPAYRAVDVHPATGFREVAADPQRRLVVGLLTTAALVEGAADVLVVLVAIELLGLAGPGVGWLNACWGAGGLLGGAAAMTLLGRGLLAGGLAAGGLLGGLSLMAIAAVGAPVAAGALLAVLGVGYALIEVAALSLLQRLSSDEVLGRAFAVVESTYWLATGLGAMVAPAVVGALGLHSALVVVGACLPLAVAVRWTALARLEAGVPVPEGAFRALRAAPVLAPLSLATVEHLSRRVEEIRVTAGDVVIREGERGDRFYVVAEGWSGVDRRGEAVAERGPGDHFGEIAVLRGIRRTATVTACGDGVLYALDRDAFLSAIGANPRSSDAVGREARTRLATVQPT